MTAITREFRGKDAQVTTRNDATPSSSLNEKEVAMRERSALTTVVDRDTASVEVVEAQLYLARYGYVS